MTVVSGSRVTWLLGATHPRCSDFWVTTQPDRKDHYAMIPIDGP
jgi:hypothetical protein